MEQSVDLFGTRVFDPSPFYHIRKVQPAGYSGNGPESRDDRVVGELNRAVDQGVRAASTFRGHGLLSDLPIGGDNGMASYVGNNLAQVDLPLGSIQPRPVPKPKREVSEPKRGSALPLCDRSLFAAPRTCKVE